MATYDSSITWDSGLRWDAADTPKPRKKMKKVKLNLQSKTDIGLHAFGTAHVEAMDGNPNYVAPAPDTPTFDSDTQAYLDALIAHSAAIAVSASTKAAKDLARTNYEDSLRTRATYIETASGGNEAKILSSGFEVAAAPIAIGDLPAPIGFLATMGDKPGEIDLSWNPVKGANVYMIQYKEHAALAPWASTTPSTASKTTIPGLDSGKEYTFQVAAFGAAGQGPWSDESVKMAT